MATDLMESDLLKLNILYQEGGESFAKHPQALQQLFEVCPVQPKVLRF